MRRRGRAATGFPLRTDGSASPIVLELQNGDTSEGVSDHEPATTRRGGTCPGRCVEEEGRDGPAGLEIPDAERLVIRTGDCVRAVERHGHGLDLFGVSFEGGEGLAGVEA